MICFRSKHVGCSDIFSFAEVLYSCMCATIHLYYCLLHRQMLC